MRSYITIICIMLTAFAYDAMAQQCPTLEQHQSPEGTLCDSGSFSFWLTFNGQQVWGEYRWYTQGPSDWVEVGSDAGFQTGVLTQSMMYKLEVDFDGCPRQTYFFYATIEGEPPPPVPVNPEICGPGSAQISVQYQLGYTYDWYESASGQKLITGASGQSLSTGQTYWIGGSGNSELNIEYTTQSLDFIVYAIPPSSSNCHFNKSAGAGVTVKPLPSVSAGEDIGFACISGPDLSLSGSPAGGTWSGPGVTGNTFSPLQAGAGMHTLTYGFTDQTTGCFASKTKKITVGPNILVGTYTTCVATSSFPLDGRSSPAGGTWSGNHVLPAQKVFEANTAGLGTHVITYTYTDEHGCTASKNGNIIVDNTAWNLPFQVSSTQVCGEGSVNLFVTNGGNDFGDVSYFLWYDDQNRLLRHENGLLVSDSYYQTPVLTAPKNYSVVGVKNGQDCQSYKVGVTANVGAPPAVPVANNVVVCGTQDAVLSVQYVQGLTYEWTEAASGTVLLTGVSGATLSTGHAYNIGGPGYSQFTVEAADRSMMFIVKAIQPGQCGLTSSTVVNIIRYPPPIVSAGSDQSICLNGSTITLSGASPTGGVWSGSGLTGSTFNPAQAGGGSHTLRYTFTDPVSGCSSYDEKVITVNPDINFLYNVTCKSSAMHILGATPAGGAWSGQYVNSVAGTFDATAASPGSHPVTYTYTDANGCTATETTNVYVNEGGWNFPYPVTSTSTCGQGSVRIAVDNGGNTTGDVAYYIWMDGNGNLLRNENGTLWQESFYDTPVLSAPLSYTVTAVNWDGCQSSPGGTLADIRPNDPPQVEGSINCEGIEGTVKVNPPQNGAGIVYEWRDAGGALFDPTSTEHGNGISYSFAGAGNSQLNLYGLPPSDYLVSVIAKNGSCPSGAAYGSITYRDNPEVILASDKAICAPGTTTLAASGEGLISFKWYLSHDLLNVWKTGAEVGSEYQSESTRQYRVQGTDQYGCSIADNVQVNLYIPPQPPLIPDMVSCAWEAVPIVVEDESVTQINVYDRGGTQVLKAGRVVSLDPSEETGEFLYDAETVSVEGCASQRTAFSVTVPANCDSRINWIQATVYDENNAVVSESKAYFDDSGHEVQTQSLTQVNRNDTPESEVFILAAQGIHDHFRRAVGSTLPAPLVAKNFAYNYWFNKSVSGRPYDYTDFDLPSTIMAPLPVSDITPGTLGWYYSENNTWEDNVPVTAFPYTRAEFYQDGTGEVKRSASQGDLHRLGTGNEALTGTFPVYQELDDYLARRRSIGIADNQIVENSLAGEAVQLVTRDQNGRYVITITDKSGASVMSARKGSAADHVLHVVNTVSVSADPEAPDYRPVSYFYVLEDQPITLATNNATYVIEDILAGATYSPQADGDSDWEAGFYRIILTSGSVSFTFSNYYLDVSCNFYDDAGRLKATVSPNGYKKWREAANPVVTYDLIDKSTYQYNFRGWLMSMTEPDAGTTEYRYRQDGKIRFSQNALQRSNEIQNNQSGRFSYTHYDALGRPVESGVYKGLEYSFNALGTQLQFSEQVVFSPDHCTDWVRTYYDHAVPSIPNLPASFVQQFVAGAVSWSENAHIQTWYSYDELGRVSWVAQKPKALNVTFVMRYQYEMLGNVTTMHTVDYVNGTAANPFYHHYEYDNNKRLLKTYTSLDGSTRTLRGSYEYYLHGPLKRIMLGDGVQGLDFVYNINGWLTQINHPDKDQDPGGDTNDVFGMILDYYESSLSGLFASSGAGRHDPDAFHNMPAMNHRSIVARQPRDISGHGLTAVKALMENIVTLRENKSNK